MAHIRKAKLDAIRSIGHLFTNFRKSAFFGSPKY